MRDAGPLSLPQPFGLPSPFGPQRAAGGVAPALANSNGTITATGGYPAPPRLTNSNGTITATAA